MPRVSSSISNWEERILKKYPDSNIFFGLYHWVDYLKFTFSRNRKVFWAGSDILNLQERPFWQRIIRNLEAEHICENGVEYEALHEMGIYADVQPIFIGDAQDFPVSYKDPKGKPHVFLSYHRGKELDYGLDEVLAIADHVPDVTFHVYGGRKLHGDEGSYGGGLKALGFDNVRMHGKVPEEQFNKEIKHYHAAIRLNEFDGFADTLAKSILLGQHPISRVKYPNMDHFRDAEHLVALLKELGNRKESNPNRQYWKELLDQPL